MSPGATIGCPEGNRIAPLRSISSGPGRARIISLATRSGTARNASSKSCRSAGSPSSSTSNSASSISMVLEVSEAFANSRSSPFGNARVSKQLDQLIANRAGRSNHCHSRLASGGHELGFRFQSFDSLAHQPPHRFASELHTLCGRAEIARSITVMHYRFNRVFDRLGLRAHAERMLQQHRSRQNRGERISFVTAGDIGRATMNRFEQTDSKTRAVYFFAERGGRQQTHRARQHRGFIGKDIAKHIFGDDDVEILGPPHQMHRHRIDQLILESDIFIFLGEIGRRSHAIAARSPECSPCPPR